MLTHMTYCWCMLAQRLQCTMFSLHSIFYYMKAGNAQSQALIEDKFVPLQNCEIGILVGYNCSRALLPRRL